MNQLSSKYYLNDYLMEHITKNFMINIKLLK